MHRRRLRTAGYAVEIREEFRQKLEPSRQMYNTCWKWWQYPSSKIIITYLCGFQLRAEHELARGKREKPPL